MTCGNSRTVTPGSASPSPRGTVRDAERLREGGSWEIQRDRGRYREIQRERQREIQGDRGRDRETRKDVVEVQGMRNRRDFCGEVDEQKPGIRTDL